MNQSFFHPVFILVALGFTLIRMYYHRKAQLAAGRIEYKERGLQVAWRLIVGIPFLLIVFAYMFRPSILAWATLPLPLWSQWLGVIFGLTSLPLIWWVQYALDINFSTVLHLRENHTLVTNGPYRWVRHPMYTVLYLHLTALLLLTSNWLIGGVALLSLTIIVVTRLHNEEATMLQRFGDQYRHYMTQTGRFLPRLKTA
jgi:protein-S-isoprenylcysteine O-methyltransferase Ste14